MEIAVSGGGDVVFFADVFHVAFGAFELSGFGAGAEGGDVCGFQCVGEAFYQGLFGPDDDKGDGVFLAEGKDVGMGGKIHSTSWLMPPLPGEQNTFCTEGACFRRQHKACSRPPEPITRSFAICVGFL